MAKRHPFEQPGYNFYKHYSVEELAEMQDVGAVDALKWAEMADLASALWPSETSRKEFQDFMIELRKNTSIS